MNKQIINRDKILNDSGSTLATFKDYTIDVRLQQFRRIRKTGRIDFINMKDDEGDRILMQIKKVDEEVFTKIVSDIYFACHVG